MPNISPSVGELITMIGAVASFIIETLAVPIFIYNYLKLIYFENKFINRIRAYEKPIPLVFLLLVF